MAFEPTLQTRLNSLVLRDTPSDAMYLTTYPLFADYFQKRIVVPDLAEDDAKIAVTLVYAWMAPAKLNTHHWINFGAAKDALQELASSDELTLDQLEDIKSFVGGSLIATSKFLHLFDPGRFAIWDRRVAWAGYRYAHYHQYNKDSLYLTYLEDLNGLTLPPPVYNLVSNALGEATEMRKKEFALFHLGIQEDVSPT
ncbi:hypothetical protein F9L00_20475 [Brucella anthropi]|uniref:Uncharacterized protein n=1 Tax=Brucella anthropi TaxID=529 RepID=A0A6L3Z7V1_BRUAN|nr:hypothetical protein [Brucella anthropi]KAB2771022.1 hypothetical protein F9L04_08485 [Brucella anthropi]KAB2774566.1 hypothetical protein F9L00_20475 [Brucella anthropi]MBM6395698.1 hypothetical protein [Brucella anthropi]